MYFAPFCEKRFVCLGLETGLWQHSTFQECQMSPYYIHTLKWEKQFPWNATNLEVE